MIDPDLERTHRQFLREIGIYEKLKADVCAAALSRITMSSDGAVKREYQFTELQRELLVMADELIEHARLRHEGLEVKCPNCGQVCYTRSDIQQRWVPRRHCNG